MWYTFHQEICRQNIQQKDYKMTLIAHGIIALDKAVKSHRFSKSFISDKEYGVLSKEIGELKTFFEQNGGKSPETTKRFVTFLSKMDLGFKNMVKDGIYVVGNETDFEKFFQKEMSEDLKKDFPNSKDIQKRIIEISKKLDKLIAHNEKMENKVWKARQRLRRLKNFEESINVVRDFDLGPLALEGLIVKVALLPITAAVKGVKELQNIAENKKIVAAQKAKAKADEEEKFKAQLAENAAKRAAKKQVDAETGVFVDLIKESSEILYRKPGKKDIGAFHAGLLNHADTDKENIIQIDDDHIAFVYDFGNGKDKELNVFFINHETGNMEQISQIKSRAGIETIELALANRKLQIAEKARLMAKRRNVNVGLKGKLANNDLHK